MLAGFFCVRPSARWTTDESLRNAESLRLSGFSRPICGNQFLLVIPTPNNGVFVVVIAGQVRVLDHDELKALLPFGFVKQEFKVAVHGSRVVVQFNINFVGIVLWRIVGATYLVKHDDARDG